MMADDGPPEEEVEEGEAWLATFADLMSLLMCFFVLLLSFSEMDLEKYRQIAGSLRLAFGVQREVVAKDPPKGVSLIAQEFSPGRPDPTVLKIMKQQGNEQARRRVDIVKMVESELEAMLSKLREALSPEINDGRVDVVRTEDEVVVRISESESFASGSAELRPSFFPILDTIAEAVAETTGNLIVAGHSDNIPISTRTFGSNWMLSSARAANVVQHFETRYVFDKQKIEIRAYADTRPLSENDSRENRANNRRVEVIVSHADYLKSLRQSIMDEYEAMVGPMPEGWIPTEFEVDESEIEEPVSSAAMSVDSAPVISAPLESMIESPVPMESATDTSATMDELPSRLFPDQSLPSQSLPLQEDDFRLDPPLEGAGDPATGGNSTLAPEASAAQGLPAALVAPTAPLNAAGVAGAAAASAGTNTDQTEAIE